MCITNFTSNKLTKMKENYIYLVLNWVFSQAEIQGLISAIFFKKRDMDLHDHLLMLLYPEINGAVFSVMVIVIGNGISDLSSNSG